MQFDNQSQQSIIFKHMREEQLTNQELEHSTYIAKLELPEKLSAKLGDSWKIPQGLNKKLDPVAIVLDKIEDKLLDNDLEERALAGRVLYFLIQDLEDKTEIPPVLMLQLEKLKQRLVNL